MKKAEKNDAGVSLFFYFCVMEYRPKHKIRLITAASLFDGHDAAINVMRRILQSHGAEVVHLGHNRSVAEVVEAAIQEDVQAVAVTSYQGGHVEYFKYMYDLLRESGSGHVRIFGGGGGTILPHELDELHAYGITRLYSPDDGRAMGLDGMIMDLLSRCDFSPLDMGGLPQTPADLRRFGTLARAMTLSEQDPSAARALLDAFGPPPFVPVVGITGTGGAGKSSLTDEITRRFLADYDDKRIAILSVDPSKRKTGGALLGDRIRMNAVAGERAFMRSFATREADVALSPHLAQAVEWARHAAFDLIVVETAGVGQADSSVTRLADVSVYVMTPEYGAASQLEKIDMLDYADLVAVNKFDKRGGRDALRDVRKQYQRNHKLFARPVDAMPVYPTIAGQYNDPGVNRFYRALMEKIVEKTGASFVSPPPRPEGESEKIYIIPPERGRYLAEIAEEIERYNRRCQTESRTARTAWQVLQTLRHLENKTHLESKPHSA
jgi:methylmalonyl-CoA mutase